MKVEAVVFQYKWAVMGNKESTLPGIIIGKNLSLDFTKVIFFVSLRSPI